MPCGRGGIPVCHLTESGPGPERESAQIARSTTTSKLHRERAIRHSALPVPLAEALGHRTDRVVDTEMGGVRKVKGGSGDVHPIARGVR